MLRDIGDGVGTALRKTAPGFLGRKSSRPVRGGRFVGYQIQMIHHRIAGLVDVGALIACGLMARSMSDPPDIASSIGGGLDRHKDRRLEVRPVRRHLHRRRDRGVEFGYDPGKLVMAVN